MPKRNLEARQRLLKHTFQMGLIFLVLLSSGFFLLDQTMAAYFKKPELEGFYIFCREITNIGYSIHYFILAALGIIVSNYFRNRIAFLKNNPNLADAIKAWSWFTIKCLVLIGILGEILKIIFGRQRPYSTDDFQNLNFVPFSTHWHWHSFPSGHTQVLFTVATIAFLIWPRHRFWFFIGAALLAFTRVAIYQHYFSDYIAGAYLGYIGTLWINYLWPPKLV